MGGASVNISFLCVSFRYKFKAQPFNPEIFRSHGELGLRQPSSLNSKPTTVPVSPLLSTKERVGLKRPRADNEEKELEKEQKKFKVIVEEVGGGIFKILESLKKDLYT